MNEFKKEIYEYFSIDINLNKEANNIYKIATKTNSICVTIRRGDFLKEKFKKTYYICDENYFINAMNKMNKIIDNPQYIVFSDDIDWCKNNWKFPNNTIYENKGNSIVEKIIIMSQCKNFIISNSTFSWWCQFLSKNEDKIVIAPKTWNRFEYSEPIFMDNWILL